MEVINDLLSFPFVSLVENPCKTNPCHSTARCVLSAEGRTCLCPLDMVMSTVDSMQSVSTKIFYLNMS